MKPNENAYPSATRYIENAGGRIEPVMEGGLTKREYFIAKAMQGALGGSKYSHLFSSDGNIYDHEYKLLSEQIICFVDTMIETLGDNNG